ncbi:unnamed protein product [Scytosiphon promiscuus]
MPHARHSRPKLALWLLLLVATPTAALLRLSSAQTHFGAWAISRSSSSTNIVMTGYGGDFETYDGGDYKVFVGRGMDRFRRSDVRGSVSDFDKAIRLQPSLAPYMWQRGLSLYYADQFEEGSKQFRKDVALNPNDTEEAIWAFLCEARMPSVGFATAQQRLLKISNERRPYMRAAYSLFKGDSTESDLAKQMEVASAKNDARAGAAYFYANLYLGLYAEAKGDDIMTSAPVSHMSAAVRSSYAKSTGDYMGDVARVHQRVRGW